MQVLEMKYNQVRSHLQHARLSQSPKARPRAAEIPLRGVPVPTALPRRAVPAFYLRGKHVPGNRGPGIAQSRSVKDRCQPFRGKETSRGTMSGNINNRAAFTLHCYMMYMMMERCADDVHIGRKNVKRRSPDSIRWYLNVRQAWN